MNLLKKLTIKNLKLNKKRTIVTIIGIMLSVALITAVATMYASGLKSLIVYEKYVKGDFHVEFMDVPSDDVKTIKNNNGVENVYLTQEIGYAPLKDSKNSGKPYAYVMGFDKDALENLSIRLTSGRLPQNEDEIIIPTHLKTNGRMDIENNKEITLEVGERVSDTYKLNQNVGYDADNEKIINTKQKTYKIVGVYERSATNIEPYIAPGYTFISYIDDTNFTGKVNVYAKYNKVGSKNHIKVTADIIGVNAEFLDKFYYGSYDNEEELINIREELDKARYEIDINGYLIALETDPISNSGIGNLGYVVIVVCIIIVFTSVFCIKNSFDISITEKIKQYGMLRSIGATKKQIKNNVFYEATILGLIGIPLGLLLGFIASYILIIVCNILLKDSLTDGLNMVLSYSVISYIVAILLGIITIYLSALKSARKASKISPIDSIRNSANIKLNSKKLKVPKLINKIFGVGGEISYKNIKRNKKSYRTTIVSLTISVLVFIALTYFMNAFMSEIKKEVSASEYNINYNITTKEDKNIINKINQTVKLDNIKNYSIIRTTNGTFNNPKYNIEHENINDNIYIVSIGEEAYKKYLKSLNLNYDDVKDKGILVDEIKYSVNKGDKIVNKQDRLYKYNKGDIVSMNLYIEPNETNINLSVGAISDVRPFGLQKNTEEVYFVVSDEYYDRINAVSSNYDVYFDSSNASKLQDDIDKILQDERYYIDNKEENVRIMRNLILLIGIFLYGFITVITLISVTNIFNTITTSMELRKPEFAMLKSVGMTSKEFNKMIRLESIFVCIKSLIFGIPIGLAISYLIYLLLSQDGGLKYHVPFNGIIISSVFVLLLISILMKYSISKINKQNTIETIRNENI